MRARRLAAVVRDPRPGPDRTRRQVARHADRLAALRDAVQAPLSDGKDQPRG